MRNSVPRAAIAIRLLRLALADVGEERHLLDRPRVEDHVVTVAEPGRERAAAGDQDEHRPARRSADPCRRRSGSSRPGAGARCESGAHRRGDPRPGCVSPSRWSAARRTARPLLHPSRGSRPPPFRLARPGPAANQPARPGGGISSAPATSPTGSTGPWTPADGMAIPSGGAGRRVRFGGSNPTRGGFAGAARPEPIRRCCGPAEPVGRSARRRPAPARRSRQ